MYSFSKIYLSFINHKTKSFVECVFFQYLKKSTQNICCYMLQDWAGGQGQFGRKS